jgi:hypothetical protein
MSFILGTNTAKNCTRQAAIVERNSLIFVPRRWEDLTFQEAIKPYRKIIFWVQMNRLSKETVSRAHQRLRFAMEARNKVGIGMSYRSASLCSLATLFQTRFLESIPRHISGLKCSTLWSPVGWWARMKSSEHASVGQCIAGTAQPSCTNWKRPRPPHLHTIAWVIHN